MKWLTQRLVDDWRKSALKRYSVRLALAAGTLSALITGNQNIALTLLSVLPANSFLRLVCAVSIGLVVFVVPTIAVLWKQNDGGSNGAG